MGGTAGSAGTDFPYSPEAVGQARRSLGGDLRRLAVAPTAADDAVLILSELVSNALRHARPLAGGKIRVAWWMEDSRVLRIAVTDGGRPEPEAAAAGRGWYGDEDFAEYSDFSETPEFHEFSEDSEFEEAGVNAALSRPRTAALTAVALHEVDESAVDGRGLGIVGALADAWGVEPFREQAFDGEGAGAEPGEPGPADDPNAPKTVWASVRVHARHAAPPDEKHRRGRGGRPGPRGRLRVLRTALAALWPGGSGGGDRREPTAWVPRYLAFPGAVA